MRGPRVSGAGPRRVASNWVRSLIGHPSAVCQGLQTIFFDDILTIVSFKVEAAVERVSKRLACGASQPLILPDVETPTSTRKLVLLAISEGREHAKHRAERILRRATVPPSEAAGPSGVVPERTPGSHLVDLREARPDRIMGLGRNGVAA